jgi:hypothetical protein
LPGVLTDARTVVVLVLDGLGWEALQQRPDLLPTIRSLEGSAVTSVVPSTTAAALTSITTGLAPSEHGLVGFRMRVEGGVLNVLSWQGEGKAKRALDPGLLQRHAPFRGRTVPVVTRAEFRSTGFTEAHLRGAEFFGWRAVSTIVERCRVLAARGEPLVYAYYPGVDEVAHAHGLFDGFYVAELGFADRLVAALLDVLPDSAALVVTADHGQIHVGPDGWLPLGPFGELVDACSGDGRFRFLHARRGAADELYDAAKREHGDHAWVMSREELLECGWLGPPPGAPVLRRIGDVVIAPFESVAIIDEALPREAGLISAHGSLTAAEIEVPLLVGRGRA